LVVKDETRGFDGLDSTRKEAESLGALVKWLQELREVAPAPIFSRLLLGDFNLGRPGTDDHVTKPNEHTWKGLLDSGFKFALDNIAPGVTNTLEFAVGEEDGKGHAYDNALLLDRLPDSVAWLAEHPRCTVLALPDDLKRMAAGRNAVCVAARKAATTELGKEWADISVSAIQTRFQKHVFKEYSDHKPLTVCLLAL